MNFTNAGTELARATSPVGVTILQNFAAPQPAIMPSGDTTPSTVPAALSVWWNPDGTMTAYGKFWTAASIVSGAACAYHGVKRHNGSVGWGLLWALVGSGLPVVGPVVAVAQGYAKPLPKGE